MIDARLITSAVGPQPIQHIRIEADSELLFGRRPCGRGLLERLIPKRLNVRIVNGRSIQSPRLRGRQLPGFVRVKSISVSSYFLCSRSFAFRAEISRMTCAARGIGDCNKPPFNLAGTEPPLLTVIAAGVLAVEPLRIEKIRTAYSKGMPCLATFCAALRSSHSNIRIASVSVVVLVVTCKQRARPGDEGREHRPERRPQAPSPHGRVPYRPLRQIGHRSFKYS
jgi:hypothetical protein